MKREWQKPKLVVLVRSRPEESILTTCKWDPIPGAIGSDVDCFEIVTETCQACVDLANS